MFDGVFGNVLTLIGFWALMLFAIWAAYFVVATIKSRYHKWVPRKERTVAGRIRVASWLMGSPVVLWVRLPGGVFMAWRSPTSTAGRQYAREFANELRRVNKDVS